MSALTTQTPIIETATDVVTKKIYIEERELAGETKLLQFSVNKTFNKISSAKLVFQDGSVSEQDFVLSNDDRFKPGNKIKIQIGFHGIVETKFVGIIIRHSIKVCQNGTSLLSLEAKDTAIKLTTARKSAYYINKSDKEIIEGIATSLNPVVDPILELHPQLVQFDATDWDFILTRAEANGMLVFCDDGNLFVKRPSTLSFPVLTAMYGKNIQEFEAEMDARNQFKEIRSTSWDYTKQQPENSDPGQSDFIENGNFNSDNLGKVLGSIINLKHPGHLKKPQLQSWSDAVAMRNKLSRAVGRVRIKGNAVVKPGTVISLSGVGDRFSGNVFVTGVLQHYEGSWQTDIQFGWNDDWFYKKEDVMDKPASGLLPGVNGLLIGKVNDVDDQEQGGQYRVKVHIPTITTGDAGIWARVATLDAGENRGSYFRPQKGDEVVLGFLSDDPREAIILGYLHSKDQKKSPLPLEDGKLQSGFVTKEGTKLIFDDSSKRITLLVPGANGEKSITINNDSSAIELKDDFNNSIIMDANGITIKSDVNVTIKGKFVKIN
ncbi:MAG: type VI secretion system tip protein VgrG [Bacteroidetes bacterium]|nr:type VI secretion system tip protein VgrG [Bacteroidota bacterium]